VLRSIIFSLHKRQGFLSNGVKAAIQHYQRSYNTNCIKLLRFVRLEQMGGSLKHSAPPELVEGLLVVMQSATFNHN
jgi:hypothetical protein